MPNACNHQISNPGHTNVLQTYPDPRDGTPVRGYRKKTISLLYRGVIGLVPYARLVRNQGEGDDAFAIRESSHQTMFLNRAKAEGLCLVTRRERRAMWKRERSK